MRKSTRLGRLTEYNQFPSSAVRVNVSSKVNSTDVSSGGLDFMSVPDKPLNSEPPVPDSKLSSSNQFSDAKVTQTPAPDTQSSTTSAVPASKLLAGSSQSSETTVTQSPGNDG